MCVRELPVKREWKFNIDLTSHSNEFPSVKGMVGGETGVIGCEPISQ